MKKRNEIILEKFKKGQTQTSLAKEYCLTRSRISSILSAQIPAEQVKEQAKLNIKARAIKRAEKNKGKKFVCKNCGKVDYTKYEKRYYCSTQCFRDFIANKSTEEERMARRKQKLREYYLRRKKLK